MSASVEPTDEPLACPSICDSVQDHPAAWDWRLLAAFVLLALVLMYIM